MSPKVIAILMRHRRETIRLALRLRECGHERALRGDRFCIDCGRSLGGLN